MKKFILIAALFAGCATTQKSEIPTAVNNRQDDFKRCYKAELDAKRPAEGRVLLKWDILPSGVTDNTSVSKSTVKNPILENCLVSIVKTIQFKPQKEKATITYPFTFSESK